MNRYLIPGLLCLNFILVAAIAGVGAQTVSEDDYGKSINEGSCMKAATQTLRAATDLAQAEHQEWNLRASQAYRELAQLGISC